MIICIYLYMYMIICIYLYMYIIVYVCKIVYYVYKNDMYTCVSMIFRKYYWI